MKETRITVAEAARTFAECVEKAHAENTTYIVMKNGLPLARLVPESKRRCKGSDLAAALATTSLSSDEARAWHEDLVSARRALRPPQDRWR